MGIIVLIHHYLICGKWYDWRDVENHEFVVAFFFGIAVGMYLNAS
jgi:hypothetical protein